MSDDGVEERQGEADEPEQPVCAHIAGDAGGSHAESHQDGLYQSGYTDEQAKKQKEAKGAIAKFLLDEGLIPFGVPVFLDAGSTVHTVAEAVFSREDDGPPRGLTILTNNMRIFRDFSNMERHSSLTLLLTGGDYDTGHQALFGDLSAQSLKQFYPHVIVMGSSGLTFADGTFYHGHTPEGVIKRAIAEKETVTRIIVTDFSKLGKRDSFLAGSWDALSETAERVIVVTTVVPSRVYDGERELDPTVFDQRWEAEKDRFNKLRENNPSVSNKLTLVRVKLNGTEDETLGVRY